MKLPIRYLPVVVTLALLFFSVSIFYLVHQRSTETRLIQSTIDEEFSHFINDSILLEITLLHQNYAFLRSWVANKSATTTVDEILVINPALNIVAAHQIQYEGTAVVDSYPHIIDKLNQQPRAKPEAVYYRSGDGSVVFVKQLEFFDQQSQKMNRQGFIYVRINLNQYHLFAQTLFQQTVWLYSAIIALFGLILFVLLKKTIVQRLANISRVMTRYAKGDKKARAELSPSGEFANVEQLINDTFDTLNAQSQALIDESLFTKQVFNTIVDGVITINTLSDIVRCNQQAANMFGYGSIEELIGKNVKCLIPTSYPDRHDSHVFQQNQRLSGQGVVGKVRQLEGLSKDGGCFPIEIVITESNIGNERFYNAFIRDKTEHQQHEQQLQQLAFYDPLTQLLNFNGFEHQLSEQQLLESHQRWQLFLIDLDGLSAINYSYGFEAGDSYLCQFGQQLQQLPLAGSLVARINTGKYLLLSYSSREQIILTLTKLLHQPIALPNLDIDVSFCSSYCSIESVQQLAEKFRHCEIALRQAKHSGRGTFLEVESQWIEELTYNARLLHSLEQAIIKNQLYFNFQPKYDVVTGLPCSAEALLRWKFNDELISPALFIPLAEQGHLMPAIDRWVIDTACLLIREWLDQGIKVQPLSINISARNLFNEETINHIFLKVGEFHIPAGLLEIEVTEHGLITDFAKASRVMIRLFKAGIGLAIDDYGTGNSNLASVLSLPVTHIKIDQSFINKGLENNKAKVILTSMLALGKSLGIKITAEGVEYKEQLDFLRENGCDYIQGYYYSKPLEKLVYENLLQHTEKQQILAND